MTIEELRRAVSVADSEALVRVELLMRALVLRQHELPQEVRSLTEKLLVAMSAREAAWVEMERWLDGELGVSNG